MDYVAQSEKVHRSIIEETIRMYEAGMAIGAIAEELGKSVTTVYSLLREGGVEPRRREESGAKSILDVLPPEVVKQVVDDYIKDISMARIMRSTDLTLGTIYRILKETDTPLRRSGQAKEISQMRLQQAVQMYVDGDKLIKIQMETGVQSNQLYKELYTQGITLRRNMP